MEIPALIFARMDSSRLPGKATKMLAGVPVLTRVIHRTRLAKEIDNVVVCTSDRGIDDPIVELATKAGASVFRGDADDVLGRALAAADGTQAVVRISGDSVFIDPRLVDWLIVKHRRLRPDLTTNVYPRTYPPGMSVEVISTAALSDADQKATDPSDREHVTTYFYRNDDRYVIDNVASPELMTDVDLALDTPEDFAFQSRLAPLITGDADLIQIVLEARRLNAEMMEPTC